MLLSTNLLQSLGVEVIISSPLERCRKGAELIGKALDVPVKTNRHLVEVNVGDWDGLERETVKKRFPEAYEKRSRNFSSFRPPGGESFNDVNKRVWPALSRISRAPGDAAAVIAHAGVNRVILCHILGIQLNNLFLIGQDFGCINIINILDQKMVCRIINCPPTVDHLNNR